MHAQWMAEQEAARAAEAQDRARKQQLAGATMEANK